MDFFYHFLCLFCPVKFQLMCFFITISEALSSTNSCLPQLREAINTGREKKNEWNDWHFKNELYILYVCPLFSLWLGVWALMKHVWSCDSAGWQRWQCIWILLIFQKCAFLHHLLPLLWQTSTTTAAAERDQQKDTVSVSLFFVFTRGSSSLCTRRVGGRDVQTISLLLVTL